MTSPSCVIGRTFPQKRSTLTGVPKFQVSTASGLHSATCTRNPRAVACSVVTPSMHATGSAAGAFFGDVHRWAIGLQERHASADSSHHVPPCHAHASQGEPASWQQKVLPTLAASRAADAAKSSTSIDATAPGGHSALRGSRACKSLLQPRIA